MKSNNNSVLIKKYMRNVKGLFPIMRKNERLYLKKMKQNVDDYCEYTSVSSMEELYGEFGKPQDIVYNYYSMIDTESLFSYIRLRRLLKYLLVSMCVILFAFTIYVCALLYIEHTIFIRQEAVFTETTITN